MNEWIDKTGLSEFLGRRRPHGLGYGSKNHINGRLKPRGLGYGPKNPHPFIYLSI
jgi:hypothetical protein